MILCCGEALIDMIPFPTTTGADGFVPHAGGAVFNTAIALGRLGAPAGLLSGISSDMFGDQLLATLRESCVSTALTILSDRPSTLAFVKLVEGQATYSFFDEGSAGRMLTSDAMPELPASITTLFFGGISLACEPCADAYASLAARDRGNRAMMIDPNIRPDFIADVDRYRERLTGMLANADIVKVSDEDLAWLMPEGGSLDEKVAELQQIGPGVVLVTRGAEGASGWLPQGQAVHVPGRRVQVADTVGAGDTFNAGVLAQLDALGCLTRSGLYNLTGADLAAALSAGVDAAAVTVSRVGANPPWRHELVPA